MTGTATGGTRHGNVLGWAGLVLCVAAIAALAFTGVGFFRAATADGVRLDDGPQEVVLPAHRTYGVFVDDADNSGYSESCSAVDRDDGHEIPMRDPSWSISSSDTEVLDFVFDTGSGRLSLSCSVPGERVTVRPVPRYAALLIGGAAGVVSGVIGVCLLIAWAVIRFAGRPTAAAGGS